MTANVAAETMPTVGTMAGENKFTPSIGKLDPYMKANSDGKPTFRLNDLLDVWRIKQAFNKKLQAAAQAAAVAAVGGAAGEGGIEVEVLDDKYMIADEDD